MAFVLGTDRSELRRLALSKMRMLALHTTANDTELREAGADWIVDDCAKLFADSMDHGEAILLLSRRQ